MRQKARLISDDTQLGGQQPQARFRDDQMNPGDAGVAAIGGFGGYPIGVQAVFAEGTPEATTLTAVSSDDDPAMDIWVARWSAPGQLAWAQRIRSYGNPTPADAWAKLEDSGSFQATFAGEAVESDPLHEGQLYLRPAGHRAFTTVRFDASGIAHGSAHPLGLAIYQGGYPYAVGVDLLAAGESRELSPEVTLTVPSSTADAETSAIGLGTWNTSGQLLHGGALQLRVPGGTWPLSLQAVTVSPGSALVYLNGSPTVALVPDEGEIVELVSDGYERIVVAHLRW